MDERAFYTESKTTRTAVLSCPHCHSSNSFELQWMIRRKKERLGGNVDERDRARFSKAQSYMVLLDDKVLCSNARCGKRFDISGIKSMAFLSPEQEAELPSRQPESQPGQGSRRKPRQQYQGQSKGKPQHQGSGNRQQSKNRKQAKKKRPKVYFPSDYVNYRP